MVTSENSTLQELKRRQTFIWNGDSFFKRVSDIAGRYNLPCPEEMQQFSKDEWKSTIKRSVREYWTNRLQEEAEDKSTLEKISLMSYSSPSRGTDSSGVGCGSVMSYGCG